MFDKDYIKDKEEEIKAKSMKNTQNFLAMVFNFVEDQRDLQQRLKELAEIKTEEPKKK